MDTIPLLKDAENKMAGKFESLLQGENRKTLNESSVYCVLHYSESRREEKEASISRPRPSVRTSYADKCVRPPRFPMQANDDAESRGGDLDARHRAARRRASGCRSGRRYLSSSSARLTYIEGGKEARKDGPVQWMPAPVRREGGRAAIAITTKARVRIHLRSCRRQRGRHTEYVNFR